MRVNGEQERKTLKTLRQQALKLKSIEDKKKGYYILVPNGINNLRKFVEHE